MDFKELHYIIALARYQNVTKAAESLYIGQPTLTKYVQSLEKNWDKSCSGDWETNSS